MSSMNSMMQYLKPEDFSGDMRYIYEAFGMTVAQQILTEYGGTTFYIPKFGSQRLRMPYIRYLVEFYEDIKPNKKKQMTFRAKHMISEGTLKNWLKEAETIINEKQRT